ncbi:hypothetical protein TNCV_2724461 [Trichonephila clavipes]|nr:hypothetical protein TNCV_2724461 [Trichonephila clavipes]
MQTHLWELDLHVALNLLSDEVDVDTPKWSYSSHTCIIYAEPIAWKKAGYDLGKRPFGRELRGCFLIVSY